MEVEVRIKMGEKEVVLGSDEAEELYFKLKAIYSIVSHPEIETKHRDRVTYPIYPPANPYCPPYPARWQVYPSFSYYYPYWTTSAVG